MTHEAGAASREGGAAARTLSGCDAILYGHTHVPQVECVGGVWFLNPGGPTERRSAPSWTMLELRIASGEIQPALVQLAR